MGGQRGVHPDCRNASNPYHECVDFCFRVIAEAKARSAAQSNTGIASLLCLSNFVFKYYSRSDESWTVVLFNGHKIIDFLCRF